MTAVESRRFIEHGIDPKLVNHEAGALLFYMKDAATVSHHLEDEPEYFWLAHAKVIRDFPLMNLSKQSLHRLIDRLIKSKLLIRHPDVSLLNRSYYALTELANKIMYPNATDDIYFNRKSIQGIVSKEEPKKRGRKPGSKNKINTGAKNNTGGIKKEGRPVSKSIPELTNIRSSNNKEYTRIIIEEEKKKFLFRKNSITHYLKDKLSNVTIENIDTAKDDPAILTMLAIEKAFQTKHNIKADEKTFHYRFFNDDAYYEFTSLLLLFKPEYMKNYDIHDAYQLYIRKRIFDDMNVIKAVIYATQQSDLIQELKPYLFTPIFCFRSSVYLANKVKAGEKKLSEYGNLTIETFKSLFEITNTYPNDYELP